MERIWTLTTNHPASSYGMPVAIIGGRPYGPMDQLNGRPLADDVKVWANEPGRSDYEKTLAGRFLRQWPDGPQLNGRPRQFVSTTPVTVRIDDPDLPRIPRNARGNPDQAWLREAIEEKLARDGL